MSIRDLAPRGEDQLLNPDPLPPLEEHSPLTEALGLPLPIPQLQSPPIPPPQPSPDVSDPSVVSNLEVKGVEHQPVV